MYTQVIVAAAFACLPFTSAKPFEKRQNGSQMLYGFDTIKATPELDWKPCFDKFTCTKLRVPLDYTNEAAGTTHVSFIRWCSNSTVANETKDILINPGGPGGSGIQLLTQRFSELIQALGTDYNLVSFDPRGVNNSGPDLSCFDGVKGTVRLYPKGFQDLVEANNTKSYYKTFQKAAAFGDFCTAAHAGANDTAKYANTIATATDMLRYTEISAKSKGQDYQKAGLWYYGISYGTVLGTTFASLFPDRVGRIIVDGVLDVEDYYKGAWKANLEDADKAVEYFFQACYDAGKNGTCGFWEESPAAIKARYQAVIGDLTLNPIPVSNVGQPDIVTIQDYDSFLVSVPYAPLLLFPVLDKILIQLEQRNASTVQLLTGIGDAPSQQCNKNPATFADLEPRIFIGCTDANGRYNLSTFDAWKDYADFLIHQSHYLGRLWASSTAITCRKLDIRAPKSQVFEGYPSANKTSNPLLFVSTKVDPVTPLSGAEKMVKRFGGARLLIQDSVGHASSSSASKCTHEHFKKYLKDASLPDIGTHCQPDKIPFQGGDSFDDGAAKMVKRHFPGI